MADLLRNYLQRVRRIVAQDRDHVLLITGAEREGKSTLAIHLARQMDPHGFDPENVVFTSRALISRARHVKPGSVLVLDEAVEGGFGREAMTERNRELVRFLVVSGARNLVFILLFTRLRFLDSYLRDHRVAAWAHVERRGQAVLRRPKRNAFSDKTSWQNVVRFSYPGPGSGDVWRYYKDRKDRFVHHGADDDDDPDAYEQALQECLDDAWPGMMERLNRAGVFDQLATWSPYPPRRSRQRMTPRQRAVLDAWEQKRRANGLPVGREACGINAKA